MTVGGSSVNTVRVMGVDVAAFKSYRDAVNCVVSEVESRGKSFWAAINPEKLYRASRDRRVRAALDRADVRICDGVGISLAARLLAGERMPRCTGCDLFETLIAAAAYRGWGVFLLGATGETNDAACENLRTRYPSLRIVGSQHGYFEDTEQVIRHINDVRPDLLFVAMGSPAQEFWIADHIDRLDVHFCLGVGGSIDVAAGQSQLRKQRRKSRVAGMFLRGSGECLGGLVGVSRGGATSG